MSSRLQRSQGFISMLDSTGNVVCCSIVPCYRCGHRPEIFGKDKYYKYRGEWMWCSVICLKLDQKFKEEDPELYAKVLEDAKRVGFI